MSASSVHFLRPGRIRIRSGLRKSQPLVVKPGDKVKIVLLNTNFNLSTSNSKKV